MKTIAFLQGPNLNLLGFREPEKYGSTTLLQLQAMIDAWCRERGVQARHYQSNHEGDLVDAIQQAWRDGVAGVVINPAAYTHTSIAILDAILGTQLPTVEVHITDITQREAFRQVSFLEPAVVGRVMGQGLDGYRQGLDILLAYLQTQE